MQRIKIAILGVVPFSIIANAWADDFCASAPDLTALQVAAVQQELMVAAFTCGDNDTDLYNTFVLTYRRDLQESDVALQAFFTRMNHASGATDTYKTKLANVYSSRSAYNSGAYCRVARVAFHAALNEGRKTLAQFAMAQPVPFDANYSSCGEQVAGGVMVTPKRVAATATAPAPYLAASKPATIPSDRLTAAPAGRNDNAASMRAYNRGSAAQQLLRRRYEANGLLAAPDSYGRNPPARGYGGSFGDGNRFGGGDPRYVYPYDRYWYGWYGSPPQYYNLRRR